MSCVTIVGVLTIFGLVYDVLRYLAKSRLADYIRNIWNSLPNYVITAESVNSFKSRLDKFWKHQELMYNYRSDCMEPGAEVSLIGYFVTSIKKVYVRSRLRGFACACRISTSTS